MTDSHESPDENPATLGIDYFNRGHWLSNIQARVSLRTRRKMFQLFLNFGSDVAGRRVLDVGATPDTERADSNCMIPWFAEASMDVSVYSPEEIGHLEQTFPFVNVLPTAGFGRPIPASDGFYDWVSASAVIEHVGSRSNQMDFLRECARVGRGVFVTTPNRFHWLEYHTKLPLIHWLPRRIHRKILMKLDMPAWASEDHLNLLSARELQSIASEAFGTDFVWVVQTVSALGMRSNLVLLARRIDGRTSG